MENYDNLAKALASRKVKCDGASAQALASRNV